MLVQSWSFLTPEVAFRGSLIQGTRWLAGALWCWISWPQDPRHGPDRPLYSQQQSQARRDEASPAQRPNATVTTLTSLEGRASISQTWKPGPSTLACSSIRGDAQEPQAESPASGHQTSAHSPPPLLCAVKLVLWVMPSQVPWACICTARGWETSQGLWAAHTTYAS